MADNAPPQEKSENTRSGLRGLLVTKFANRLVLPIYMFLLLAILTVSFLRTAFVGQFFRVVHFLNGLLSIQWGKLFTDVSGDQFLLHVVVSWLLLVSSYWVVGVLFTALDVRGKPEVMLQYKVQPIDSHKYPVSGKCLIPVVKQVLFNQTVVAFPTLVVLFYCKTFLGYYDTGSKLPTLFRVSLEIFGFMLIEEVFFYYAHRVLHNPLFYKYYHKQHHEWTSPVAITALYCHPVEHVLSNVLPTFAGPFLLGSHAVTQWIWILMTAPYGLVVHSGYHLPFLPSSEAHDFHHLKFTVNYGVLGLLDWLHGTDDLFRKSESYKHHFLLLSFKPVRTLLSNKKQQNKKMTGTS